MTCKCELIFYVETIEECCVFYVLPLGDLFSIIHVWLASRCGNQLLLGNAQVPPGEQRSDPPPPPHSTRPCGTDETGSTWRGPPHPLSSSTDGSPPLVFPSASHTILPWLPRAAVAMAPAAAAARRPAMGLPPPLLQGAPPWVTPPPLQVPAAPPPPGCCSSAAAPLLLRRAAARSQRFAPAPPRASWSLPPATTTRASWLLPPATITLASRWSTPSNSGRRFAPSWSLQPTTTSRDPPRQSRRRRPRESLPRAALLRASLLQKVVVAATEGRRSCYKSPSALLHPFFATISPARIH